MRKIFLTTAASLAVMLSPIQPANAAPADGANDPGAQLERTREQMERQRIAEQIAEDEQNRKVQVENQDETSNPFG